MASWRVQNDWLIVEAKAWTWLMDRSACSSGTSWRRMDFAKQSHSVVTLKDGMMELLSLHDNTTADGTSCVSWDKNMYFSTNEGQEWVVRDKAHRLCWISLISTYQHICRSTFPLLNFHLCPGRLICVVMSQASPTFSWVRPVGTTGRSESEGGQCVDSHGSFLVSSL